MSAAGYGSKDLDFEQDLKNGFGEVYLPGALDRKYSCAKGMGDASMSFPAQGSQLIPAAGRPGGIMSVMVLFKRR